MGSPEAEWGHPPYAETQLGVTLTRSFLIQQTEVTIEQWTGLGLANPTDDPSNCLESDCPVASVTWFEALAYANLLSESHEPPFEPCYLLNGCEGEVGKDLVCTGASVTAETVYDCEGFRLPTDAEWEYAARSGTKTAYYSGENVAYGDQTRCGLYCNPDANLEKIGWYCYNSGGQSHPAKQLMPNGWGLYDTAGNVFEWVYDEYDGVGARTAVDPVEPGDPSDRQRSRRGGRFGIWAQACRSASGLSDNWNLRGLGTGFRLIRTLQ